MPIAVAVGHAIPTSKSNTGILVLHNSQYRILVINTGIIGRYFGITVLKIGPGSQDPGFCNTGISCFRCTVSILAIVQNNSRLDYLIYISIVLSIDNIRPKMAILTHLVQTFIKNSLKMFHKHKKIANY